MNIVGVSACSAGIAHTYIAKEKIEQAAKLLGHKCKVETQGSIGVEDELTAADMELLQDGFLRLDFSDGNSRLSEAQVITISLSTLSGRVLRADLKIGV